MRRRTSQTLPRRLSLLFLLLIVALGGFLLFKGISYVPVLYQLFFQKEIELKKTEDQRINLLLLGIGGGKHDGPLLTDTVIFVSIDPILNKITMVTIPRDLWIPELKQKINFAYASGEAKKDGGGLMLTKAVVEKIMGQKVDYGFRVDFNGFIRAVDMIGGIDVDVERAFDDYEYPLSGKEADTCGFEGEEFEKRATAEAQLEAFPCRYEHLRFEEGIQHMDGETALKFVRSRHATGSEGTDFARSKRQEKIIASFQSKVLSVGTFLNPLKLVSLYDVFQDSIDTDIKKEEYDDFVKLAQKMREAVMKNYVIDYGDDIQGRPGLLINPLITEEFNLQWVLIPRAGSGDYSEIQLYVTCLQETLGDECSITPTTIPSITE
jgi:LCP family protein required for cell wall assembly